MPTVAIRVACNAGCRVLMRRLGNSINNNGVAGV